ncbi:MAG: sulfur carrier protein ThiS [Candidatus Sedimenticola endophacoides]|uniref:Thiamine biosynthesis protein ThiS n=1 Tax=Candidatus Sedimenticola endophacoides TaxID=2548426 RepID=A0A657PM41_9GAMM|nr:MAG: thiamine biosynthesis protein ThiS [Candidatus Sedimenticola endophacoides]OQX36775.1 MAG: thiamine biosynthesis protein ThiS [Candidatus Sedimenticola endophacoides]OQX39618.1 MAG: thiamine biosynthesis protein ThiS [Candidatus Sedimenticola endophacoides]OQX40952.1 MAG: thiamine biosynthesis protein ThiS [Candidatus Sedimenticola endophacoides]OQX42050.1 MAG: thiamine biosynthesis protein ThiS [Candidatus Sedimenticola endophacoides]
MQIYINGQRREVPDACTMQTLVNLLALGEQRYAVEVNEELVPRSQFEHHCLAPDDQVEIVNAIGGG